MEHDYHKHGSTDSEHKAAMRLVDRVEPMLAGETNVTALTFAMGIVGGTIGRMKEEEGKEKTRHHMMAMFALFLAIDKEYELGCIENNG